MAARYRYLGEGLFILGLKEKALIQFMGKNTDLMNVKIFGTIAVGKVYRYILFVYQFMFIYLYFILTSLSIQTHPDLHSFKLRNLKKVKSRRNNIF
jgi:hypothetical protein